jgi:uncharacterized membrane protein
MKFNHLMGVVALSAIPTITYADAFDVQELPVSSLSANQFSVSIDNAGLALVSLENPFNPPIDLSLLNVADFPGLSDPEQAALGNFTLNDYQGLAAAFRSNNNNLSTTGQKLASIIGYKTDGTEAEYVSGVDVVRDGTNGFTFSMNIGLEGSVDGDFIIGTSPGAFYPVEYINEAEETVTAVINDFLLRGFVEVNGQTKSLMPVDDTLSGRSETKAINQNLQVVGSSSVMASDSIRTLIDDCNDESITIPLEVCLYQARPRASEQFTRRATVWQLDAQGDTISTQTYGLSFVPAEDDIRNYFNEALDINNQGLAVGVGSVVGEFSLRTLAMRFEDGITTRLLPEEDEPEDSTAGSFAIGINDDGLVAGYQARVVNGSTVAAKLFVYDTNTDTLNFPSDFFISSNTFPRDINNNGIIVGDAEVDARQNPRPRAAFMYDIAKDEFTDLNTMIACDSPYTIVSANSINDNNEILVDAVIVKTQRNILGEPALNSDGEQFTQSSVVALKLTPTGAAAPICELGEAELEASERQGASNSLVFVMFLLSILGFRRIKR